MSSGSLLDAKEQVRQATDIVELVGQYVRLQRKGQIYVGLCPWHDDSNPSLQVNPQRQSFKCWVCDVGGDVFSFIMKHEGVTFREALDMLAERAGIELKPRRGQPAQPGGPADKRTLYQAMAWAETEYHRFLLEEPAAEPARQYLAERGITEQSIERFRIGFAPTERDWLMRRVGNDPGRLKIVEAVGLLGRGRESRNLYEPFRGRLLFSIHNVEGKPVGLGGRVLPEVPTVTPAKYYNTPETLLFRKSELLYGLDLAKEAIRKSQPRSALIMEGYTDVIAAHQAGFENAVAVLGTALGAAHVRLLKRFADKIVLVLDGDEAGQRRAAEVLELFVAQQVDLEVVTLPEGNDPADFIRQNGREAFAELLENKSLGALDHAFAVATRGLDFERDVNGVDRALEQLLSIVAKAPRLSSATDAQNQARQWKLLGTLALKFRVPEETLHARLRELRQQAARRPAPVARAPREGGAEPAAGPPADDHADEARPVPLDTCARECLELLVLHPECLGVVRGRLTERDIASPPGRRIFETLCRLSEEGQPATFDRLMLELEDPSIQSLLVELDERGRAKGFEDPEQRLNSLIDVLRKRETERRLRAQASALREGILPDEEAAQVVSQIVQQRRGTSEPTDG